MQPVILESCHSTWVFDPQRMEFCRILRHVVVGGTRVTTQWRRYYRLVEDSRTFAVELDPSGTRRLRCFHHAENCRECGGSTAVSRIDEELQAALATA